MIAQPMISDHDVTGSPRQFAESSAPSKSPSSEPAEAAADAQQDDDVGQPGPPCLPRKPAHVSVGLRSHFRHALGEAYYRASYPARLWYERRLANAGQAPIAVLTFHRIADDHANLWTTRTDDFIKVLRWLKSRFELISLAELQRRVREGFNVHASVCITFDDGYADNCRAALPLLIEERVPCTYFVTNSAVLDGKPFAHDTQMGNEGLMPNTIEQLWQLSRAGIEIGAHTRSHANLGRITDPQQMFDELVAARSDLEAAIGREIRYFAFPFGRVENLSTAAFEAAWDAGYRGVCSAYGGWNYPGDNAFHIRRRGVDGPPNRAKNWALIDPVRSLRLPQFLAPERTNAAPPTPS
jgi:peptidoglycan/xylan/chitin deacetylase (PgdA/CDA1 family)